MRDELKEKKRFLFLCFVIYQRGRGVWGDDVGSGPFVNGRPVGKSRRGRHRLVVGVVVVAFGPAGLFQHQAEQIDAFGGQQPVLGLARLTPHVHHRRGGLIRRWPIDRSFVIRAIR